MEEAQRILEAIKMALCKYDGLLLVPNKYKNTLLVQ